jgi:probable selenium-dependent hydroxylase accessory protein YqeC
LRRLGWDRLARTLDVGRGDLVSLVGGGGKTSLMYRLVRDLNSNGMRAAAATTTKIEVPCGEGVRLVCAEDREQLRAALEEWGDAAPVLGRRVLSSGKVEGIPPAWCDLVLAEGWVEVLVVEADGSARKPVKAPAAWEPVVPEKTTVFVAMVGLTCLGKPLLPENVFRAELFSAVTGLSQGERVSTQSLLSLLTSPQGLLKGYPPSARALAFLNQSDVPGVMRAAREVAQGLLEEEGPYERVLIGSLREQGSSGEAWVK